MITSKGLISFARREQRKLLQQAGLEKEWRRLQRRFRKELGADIYLYQDSCPEFYNGPLYVTEVVKNLPDGLIYVTVKSSVDEVVRDLEDYLNE